jgi:hypothetical protein
MARSITVSLALAQDWPTAGELELRHELQAEIDRALAGDGYVEGGGGGMGAMDIFIAGVLETERAVNRITMILDDRGLLGTATIRVNDDESAN